MAAQRRYEADNNRGMRSEAGGFREKLARKEEMEKKAERDAAAGGGEGLKVLQTLMLLIKIAFLCDILLAVARSL